MLKFLFLLFVVFFSIMAKSYAKLDVSSLANNISDYFSKPVVNKINTATIQNTIFDIIVTIGWISALFIVLITGIKFMLANSQQKAMLKDKLWLIATGVILLAIGPTLLNIVIGIIYGTF